MYENYIRLTIEWGVMAFTVGVWVLAFWVGARSFDRTGNAIIGLFAGIAALLFFGGIAWVVQEKAGVLRDIQPVVDIDLTTCKPDGVAGNLSLWWYGPTRFWIHQQVKLELWLDWFDATASLPCDSEDCGYWDRDERVNCLRHAEQMLRTIP